MTELLTLGDEPLPESASTIVLEIRSVADSGTRREGDPDQQTELEGRITLNPEYVHIFSLPAEVVPAQFSGLDRTLWDLYLVVFSFTLHKPQKKDSYYEDMTFRINMLERHAIAFDLFPQEITTSAEGPGTYSISPQGTIIPVEAGPAYQGQYIRLLSLHPTITAFGQGERTFYWHYGTAPDEKGIRPGTRHVLAVLQVPHQTAQVSAKISYDLMIARKLAGFWTYLDARVGTYRGEWDLSKALPFTIPTAQPSRNPNPVLPQTVKAANEQYDVCVVCALATEARAFLEEVALRCHVQFSRAIHKELNIEYEHARILNVQGKQLTLQVSWLPGMGSVEAVLHLKSLLEAFRPRLVGMTGICAGNPEKVKLGDLIVARRAYFYDSGKYILGSSGQPELMHNVDIYEVSPRVRAFLPMFEPWKESIGESVPNCHHGDLASVAAVRGDHLFERAAFPTRHTFGLDMEGAAFYRVARDFPATEALLVKGVSDYADGDKDDAYHWRASTLSARYMLAFIQQFVTEQRLPGNPPSA